MYAENIAISLDLINRHYQEPNRNRYESRYFWEELYGLIAASGFSTIEIPYEPVWQFGGRSGVPFNRYCINTKYGDAAHYRALLAASGISRVNAGEIKDDRCTLLQAGTGPGAVALSVFVDAMSLQQAIDNRQSYATAQPARLYCATHDATTYATMASTMSLTDTSPPTSA